MNEELSLYAKLWIPTTFQQDNLCIKIVSALSTQAQWNSVYKLL